MSSNKKSLGVPLRVGLSGSTLRSGPEDGTSPTIPHAKERPILFSGPMVRAILEGRKTQTRRIIKPQPPSYLQPPNREFRPIHGTDLWGAFAVAGSAAAVRSQDTIKCPYGKPGDRLWVRETWGHNPEGPGYVYRSDGDFDMKFHGDRWRPSIHMPRWASRITLEVTGVRVERLRDISEEDALAEGVERGNGRWMVGDESYQRDIYGFWVPGRHERHNAPSHAFRSLWESINGPGSWDANPFVWVVEFRRVSDGKSAKRVRRTEPLNSAAAKPRRPNPNSSRP